MKHFRTFLKEMASKLDDFETKKPSNHMSTHDVYVANKKGENHHIKFSSEYGDFEELIDNDLMIINEYFVYEIYRFFKIRVPDAELVEDKGKLGLSTVTEKGSHVNIIELPKYPDLMKGVPVDILCAVWDSTGTGDLASNLIMNKDKVIRIDRTGLQFRARGGRKGAKFSHKVGEFETFRNPNISNLANSIDTNKDKLIESLKEFSSTSKSEFEKELHIISNHIELEIESMDLNNKKELMNRWKVDEEEIFSKLISRFDHMIESIPYWIKSLSS